MKLLTTILIGIAAGLWITISPASIVYLVLLAIFIFIIQKYARADSKSFLLKIFILGVAVRVILVCANYYTPLALRTISDTQPDAVVYDGHAFYISCIFKEGNCAKDFDRHPELERIVAREDYELDRVPPPPGGYQYGWNVYLFGVFYSLFGYSPIAAKIITCLFGSMIGIMVYAIGGRLNMPEKVSRLAAAITMFFPSLLYWSVTLLKDSIITFFFLVFVYFLLRYLEDNNKKFLGMAFISAIFFNIFKEKLLPIICLIFLFIMGAQILRKIKKGSILIKLILAFLVIIFIVGVIAANVQILEMAKKVLKSTLSYNFSSAQDKTASVYNVYKSHFYTTSIEMSLHSILDFGLVFSILKALFYYFFSPFPWYIPFNHPLLLIFYPQVMITILGIPLILLGIQSSLRNRFFLTATLLALLAITIIPQAMAESIIGTTVRHRDMFTPFMILFFSYGFCLKTSLGKKKQ